MAQAPQISTNLSVHLEAAMQAAITQAPANPSLNQA
jgi:hypothetical protein